METHQDLHEVLFESRNENKITQLCLTFGKPWTVISPGSLSMGFSMSEDTGMGFLISFSSGMFLTPEV